MARSFFQKHEIREEFRSCGIQALLLGHFLRPGLSLG
jgi:hypothetical protein